jgi:hypothetical protein
MSKGKKREVPCTKFMIASQNGSQDLKGASTTPAGKIQVQTSRLFAKQT